jgi:hypothetical protein
MCHRRQSCVTLWSIACDRPGALPTTQHLAGSVIPQSGLAGDMRISYSKFLQLLEADRVKRVVVYGDMKTAVVEVRAAGCLYVGVALKKDSACKLSRAHH